MTKEETVKILSILKVAYPNFYKGLNKEEATAVINLWYMHLGKVPYDIVSMAINKLIATSIFPPAIAEVKAKLNGMYAEAIEEMILTDKNDRSKIESLNRIAENCRCIDDEPSLNALLNSSRRRMAITDETYDKQ